MKLFQLCVCLLLGIVTAGCSEPVTKVVPDPQKASDETQDYELRVVDDWLIAKHVNQDNVNQLVADARIQGAVRLRFSYPLPIRDAEAHREILDQIGKSCPKLLALELHQFSIKPSELASAILKLSNLQELRLDQCVFDPVDTGWIDQQIELDVLNLRYCQGLEDQQVGQLLAASPNLRELTVTAPITQGRSLTGQGWPLHKMRELQKFTSYDASDELIRRVVAMSPALTSLELTHSERLAGQGWQFLNRDAFRELHLAHCDSLTEANLQEIVQQLPNLKSLSLTGYGKATAASVDPKSLSSLTSLRLAGPNLDFDFVARTVRNATELELLRIHSVYPAKNVPLEFGHLKRLREFDIDGCSVPPHFPATLSATIEHLHIGHCDASNSSLAAMLPRMQNLKTLDLHWLGGFESDPEAVTGEGWDFSKLAKLEELDLTKSRHLNNEIIPRLARQVPGLRKLKLSENQRLTGDGWELAGFHQLSELSLRQLTKLKDDAINKLPRSLERLQIERCPQLIGSSWQLASFPKLESLQIGHCEELVSLGRELPHSLRELHAVECEKLRCGDLDYDSLQNCLTINFRDCRSFDVDRLFVNVVRGCEHLQFLYLSGCPDVTVRGWDFSPLNATLESFHYYEGEPSYFGGASEETARNLSDQLSDRFECDHTR